jgi:dihydrofolate reductase
VKEDVGFADKMNSMPKYVVSTTFEKLDWNNSRLIKANVAEEVKKLKEQPGKGILVYGSGKLVNTLLQRDLVDELLLMVHPVVLGSGNRLFDDSAETNGGLETGRVEDVSLRHRSPLLPPSKGVMICSELIV